MLKMFNRSIWESESKLDKVLAREFNQKKESNNIGVKYHIKAILIEKQ